jgi:hypothetical protein
MPFPVRTINLSGQIEVIDSNDSIWYRATTERGQWSGLVRTRDGRWYGDEDIQLPWQEVTPYDAFRWCKSNRPDHPIPPVLIDDVNGEQDTAPAPALQANGKPGRKRGRKHKHPAHVRAAILKEHANGITDHYAIAKTVSAALGYKLTRGDVYTVVNTDSKQKSRASRKS